MSNTLAQSFQNLNLRNDRNKGAPPIPLTIPQRMTYGRRMYFGIETTEEWLVEYATKCGYIPPFPSKYDSVGQALVLLEANSGIRIIPQSAFAQSTPIPPPITKVTYPLKEAEAIIVAICSDSPRSFAKRPSQERVDVLKQIMGREAMWWVEAS